MDISRYFKSDRSNSTRADKSKTKRNRKNFCREDLGSSDDDFIFERKKKRIKKNEKKEVLNIIDLDPNSEAENIGEIDLKIADTIKIGNFPGSNENCKPISDIMKGKNETENSIIVISTKSQKLIKNTDTSIFQTNFQYLDKCNTRTMRNPSKPSSDKTIMNPKKSNENSNSSPVTITKQHENKTTYNSDPFSSVINETKSNFEQPTCKIGIDKSSVGENAKGNRRDITENRKELSLSFVEGKRGIEKGVEGDEEHSLWNCEKCTFLNHELLSKCEICGFERKKKNLNLVSEKRDHCEENTVLCETNLEEGCDKNKYEHKITVPNMPFTETYAPKNFVESNSNIQNESFATNASFGNIKQCMETKPLYNHNNSDTELFFSGNLGSEGEQSLTFTDDNFLDDAEQLSDSTWNNSSSESQANDPCNFKDASTEFKDSPFFMSMHHLLDDQKEHPHNASESSDISLYPSNTSNLSIWNDDLLQDKDEIDDIMAELDGKQMMLQESMSDSSISESEQEEKIGIKKLSYRPSIYTSRVFVYDQVIPQFQQQNMKVDYK